jgi:hypothetical protein
MKIGQIRKEEETDGNGIMSTVPKQNPPSTQKI